MLNKVTIKNRYPLPRIDELLDRLNGKTIYSSLDLLDGYYQIGINEEDQQKAAFTTPFGHYEFKVLPMGISNAPSTFQAVMNNLFADYIHQKFVMIYLDDILIMSSSPEEHAHHLTLVLQRMHDNKIYAKLYKCDFNSPEVKFLGHIVGRDGIKVDPAKIAVVRDWPLLQSTTEIRQFWGLANYFRKFIQGYSSLAAPLMILLAGKDKSVMLNALQINIFEAIKHA